MDTGFVSMPPFPPFIAFKVPDSATRPPSHKYIDRDEKRVRADSNPDNLT